MPRKKTAIPDEQPVEGLPPQAEENSDQIPEADAFPDTAPAGEGAGEELPPASEAPDMSAGSVVDGNLPGEDAPADGGEASGAVLSDVPAGEEPPGGPASSDLSSGSTPDMPGDFPPGEESPFPDSGGAGNPHPLDGMTPESDDPEYGALLQEWGEAEHSDIGGEAPLTLAPLPDDVPSSGSPDTADPEEDRTGEAPPPSARSRDRPRRDRVLTIEARDEVQTAEEREAIIWHEIQNAHWTRRILTGTLDGVERTESGLTVAVVNYKGFRVAIPVKEMLLFTGKVPSGAEFQELMSRMRGILTARLGSEIDFIVKGHENKSRSVVASRRDAMYRKRQTFYLDKDERGEPMISEGRVVQARVVAVAEKVIRVEVFGVECAIVARGLSRAWIGNAAKQYHVGGRILVRVQKISGTTVEDLTIAADVRSTSADTAGDDLKKCVRQGRYAGRVTDVRGGVLYVRLNNGVNAIAHSCYDRRTPGKGDDVSFSVTRLDEAQGVAVGLITRIIKQNL